MEDLDFESDLEALQRWYRNLPLAVQLILGPVLGVMVVGGIVAGFSFDLAQQLFKHLSNTIPIPVWLIVISVALLLIFLSVATFYFFSSKRRAVIRGEKLLNSEKKVLLHIVKLDETLFRLMPKLTNPVDREQAMKKLLREMLRNGCAVFGDRVSRASLLLPVQHDYLKPWVTSMMPPESVRAMSFYIGSDDNRRRGIAGKAYRNQQVYLAHIYLDAKTGKWVSDDPDYVHHNAPNAPGYRSFVAVPVLSGETTCGVVCFDSMDIDIFDSSDIQKVLLPLAKRVAAALEVYEGLKETAKSPVIDKQISSPVGTQQNKSSSSRKRRNHRQRK